MAQTTSIRRVYRSRPAWFWLYAVVSLLLLLTLMFLLAERNTRTTSQFEPAVSQLAEPENEFVPVDRSVSECISAIPKPGCGSDARGGWHQTLVLLVILGGLGVIAWRIVVGARKARQTGSSISSS